MKACIKIYIKLTIGMLVLRRGWCYFIGSNDETRQRTTTYDADYGAIFVRMSLNYCYRY